MFRSSTYYGELNYLRHDLLLKELLLLYYVLVCCNHVCFNDHVDSIANKMLFIFTPYGVDADHHRNHRAGCRHITVIRVVWDRVQCEAYSIQYYSILAEFLVVTRIIISYCYILPLEVVTVVAVTIVSIGLGCRHIWGQDWLGLVFKFRCKIHSIQ